MSKKLRKILESDESLKEKLGDKFQTVIDAFITNIEADDDTEPDTSVLYHYIMNKHRPAIENELKGHFNGRFTNEKGRSLLAKLKSIGINQDDVKDESGNIQWDLIEQKMEEKHTELLDKISKGPGDGSEEVKALKKSISEIQAKYDQDTESLKKERDSAFGERDNYISTAERRKILTAKAKEAYQGKTLREGITIEDIVEGYEMLAEKSGIDFKVENGSLAAYKKGSEQPYLIDNVHNLDISKHLRETVDPKFNPVAVAGKSFDRKTEFDQGEDNKPTGDNQLDAMDEAMKEVFGK